MNNLVSEIDREQVRKLASRESRIDGRAFDEYRPLDFEVNPIGTADGSARVKLGKTDILVGVKLGPGQPYPDHPDEGVLTTGCELKPMAHPAFTFTGPRDDSIELARVIDRGIRESGMLDLKSLAIKPGESVWTLYLDIQVIDFDGNIFDAATLGAVLALHNTILPASKHGLGEDRPLELKGRPLTVTTVKIGDSLLVDPVLTEELVADARLTVSVDDGNHIRAMQKGLSGALTSEDVAKAVDTAIRVSGQLRNKILNGE